MTVKTRQHATAQTHKYTHTHTNNFLRQTLNCDDINRLTSSILCTPRKPRSDENSWSLNTVNPSFKLN